MASAAVLLSGCFSITSQTAEQRDIVGDAVITTEMCVKDSSKILTDGTCEAGLPGKGPGDVQFYFGYLLPSWAQASPTIRWTGDVGQFDIAASAEYAAAVEQATPAPAGFHWAGYATGRVPALAAHQRLAMTAQARFALANGTASTLPFATVTGWRYVRDASAEGAAWPVDRPITCTIVDAQTGDSGTSCLADGRPVPPTTPGAAVPSESLPLNLLTLTPLPATVTAAAGTTATLGFSVATHAAADKVAVPMAATTTVPGAVADGPASIEIGGADAPTQVRVAIPAGTAAGDYTVALATAAGLRRAEATLRVTRPAAPPARVPQAETAPVAIGKAKTPADTAKFLVAAIKDPTLAAAMRSGKPFGLTVDLPQAGTVRVRLLTNPKRKAGAKKAARRRVLATGSATADGARLVRLQMQPSKLGKTTLARGGRLRGVLEVRFGAREVTTLMKPVTLDLGRRG